MDRRDGGRAARHRRRGPHHRRGPKGADERAVEGVHLGHVAVVQRRAGRGRLLGGVKARPRRAVHALHDPGRAGPVAAGAVGGELGAGAAGAEAAGAGAGDVRAWGSWMQVVRRLGGCVCLARACVCMWVWGVGGGLESVGAQAHDLWPAAPCTRASATAAFPACGATTNNNGCPQQQRRTSAVAERDWRRRRPWTYTPPQPTSWVSPLHPPALCAVGVRPPTRPHPRPLPAPLTFALYTSTASGVAVFWPHAVASSPMASFSWLTRRMPMYCRARGGGGGRWGAAHVIHCWKTAMQRRPA